MVLSAFRIVKDCQATHLALCFMFGFYFQQSGVHHAQNPDQYRGVFGSDGLQYARDVDEIITYGTSGRVAAFIAEAIQVMI